MHLEVSTQDPSSALMKAAAWSMRSIQRSSDDLKSPTQLVPGEYVKCAGEWVRFVGLSAEGLRVYRPDSACEWTYTPTVGELFVWHPGAF